MANWNNYPSNDGSGRSTYVDVDTGNITIVHDNGCGGGSIFNL